MNNRVNTDLKEPVDSSVIGPANILVTNRPKLGFTGIGWIGRNRLDSIRASRSGEITAVVDPDASAIAALQSDLPDVVVCSSFDEMLDSDVEGVVIASPSALHAGQALQALKKGKAVFCQKPLGRSEQETSEVVEEARSRDLLLGVDFSYRYISALQQVERTVRSGELGRIYAIKLTFHNAYGPDKPWYYNSEEAGGGCVMDLGIHLVDMLFGIFESPRISDMQSQLFHKGKLLTQDPRKDVEDYAAAQFVINDNTVVQFACSWDLPAGRDALIEATLYGEYGGASFQNVNGSFYDFKAEKYSGTSTNILDAPPDNWQGRAAVMWSRKLAQGGGFDTEAESWIQVARVLDQIYHSR